VGKRAEDNDELSTNSKYRSGRDWWLHAVGSPGSHVVVRCEDSELSDEVCLDAASLAARHSKLGTSGTNVIKVSLTKVSNVSKPTGAKPGLVYLGSQTVRTIRVDLSNSNTLERLERLDSTVVG